MARVGFIGLGNMGAPMAANLLAAGHQVGGYDLVEAARDELAQRGGIACASSAQAAQDAEVIVTMLPAGRHVRAVLDGPDGLFAQLAAGTLIIDCSTIDPVTARDLHAAARGYGLALLDAPVSGGITGAAAGTLTFMVGGEAATLDRARPLLGCMGRTIVHAGGAGAGQAAKICNNMILGISMAAVAEAFALADKLGLSAQALFDVASKSSGQCWALTSYCPVPGPVPQSPANRGYQAGFAASLMAKDLGLAVEAQEATGTVGLLAPWALSAYEALIAQGLGDKDFSIVAEALRIGALPASTLPSSRAGGGGG